MKPTMEVALHEAVIEKLKLSVTTYLAREHWNGLKDSLSIEIDSIAGQMAVRLMSHVLSTKTTTVSIEKQWPKDWWQALRERWFPQWWLSRWPVQYERYSFHKTFPGKVCPHVSIASHDQHIRFLIRDEEDEQVYLEPEDAIVKSPS